MSVRQVIGLMSGTSLDGVDAAWLETDGEFHNKPRASVFIPYSDEDRELLIEARAAAESWNFNGPPPNVIARAEDLITRRHIEAVKVLEAKVGLSADLIGLHGQTVLHRPEPAIRKTLQIGRGDQMARVLNRAVAFDFRSEDVRRGGQGAPLASGYHAALMAAHEEDWAVLNIGGVSNITLGRGAEILLGTDCGPGGGPLDSWMARKSATPYDAGGATALRGVPHIALIEEALEATFFSLPLPRSADVLDFKIAPAMDGASLTLEDGAATCVAFTSRAVALTLKQSDSRPEQLVVCGGGRKNRALLAALAEDCGCKITSAENLGWDGDNLEAEAFAWLAARVQDGRPLSWPQTTGVSAPCPGGTFITP